MPYTVSPLTAQLDNLEPLYSAYSAVAQSDYGWPEAMVPFEVFKSLCEQGAFQGYVACDLLSKIPAGLLVLEVSDYGVIEPRILYVSPDAGTKSVLDTLFKQFMKDLEKSGGWKSVSFAMLGPAMRELAQYMPWYGFKPVAQASVVFDLLNPMTAQVFQCYEASALPPGLGLKVVDWKAATKLMPKRVLEKVIHEAFESSVDALWDPRFWGVESIADIVRFVTEGHYGTFFPEASRLVLNAKNNPVGFCFLSQLGGSEANIPLIGVAKAYRRQKLGPLMVAAVLRHVIQDVMSQKLYIKTITATVATDNTPAIRMYRSLGFCEQYWYPHVYLTPEILQAFNARPTC
jgi:ribosomal protein S18 acetylase RimI-like enzyme